MSGDKFEEDDDVPQLSAETLKALQEFYAESQASLENLKEDWVRDREIFFLQINKNNNFVSFLNNLKQLSQFWYDKNTSETLTKEVLTSAFESKRYCNKLYLFILLFLFL